MRRDDKARAAALLMLLALAGCDRAQVEGKAQEALEQAETAVGSVIIDGLDKLKNADHPGGPFENDMDSAREYLLGQLSEKYGKEFLVTGNESLVNYGLVAGATYTCEAAPAENPDQVFRALVSQTMYQRVRDSYAVYLYKEEAEAPVLAFCQEKDYVLDQQVSLEMPETSVTWTGEDSVRFFLRNSGASVRVVLWLEDGLDTDAYTDQLLDFLGGVGELSCNLTLQARTSELYLYHRELSVLEGFDPAGITPEEIQSTMEIMRRAGAPR